MNYVFDEPLARYFLKKYKKRKDKKKEKLLSQILYLHDFLVEITDILGKDLLIYGLFPYNVLKEVIEEDLGYNLNCPKTLKDYKNGQKLINNKFLINFS